MTEQWRPVPGFEGRYEVSDQGRVRSFVRTGSAGWPYMLSANYAKRGGYPQYTLGGRGKEFGRNYRVHELVAAAFIGPRPTGQVVRHLDGDPLNNHPSNLAYGTYSENNEDTIRHGHNPYSNMTHCGAGHPYDEANTRRADGRRHCRPCAARRQRERRARLATVTNGGTVAA